MTSIYDQHDAAFRNVSAYVVMKKGALVAKLAFKFPKDGAGRLYCYLHFPGIEMVRGSAAGYGYEKRSAAASSATNLVQRDYLDSDAIAALESLRKDGGEYWDTKLRNAGFEVIQAV